MKQILFILSVLVLSISCSPVKRIQNLAEKHGEHVKDTLHLDTNTTVPGIHFDSIIEKEIDQDSNSCFVDTTELILEDGTRIEIIDSTKIIRSKNNEPDKLKSKRVYSIDVPEKEVPINMDLPYDKIEVNPPDKWDMLLENIKWLAIMALAIALIISTLIKLFK